ncbi:hypothetical protein GRI62_13940 [Erythrobacter arachoides]|uniref:Uncharacterized protein n=1 Tax=Aurantiacibacter arachoides TaxID=1850444 RepID=A0A845A2D6_9SPHN|nr:hypothetical protein [Aurantiacibacter arachoides]MXO94701.1 hypothetical protein [Aurantiacibacter arachoides]GGD61367.1 hypothetical protein GCM10011411_22020 [Aurantiacibacter arachoides]
MFEGKLPTPPAADDRIHGDPADNSTGEDLSRLTWSDLVAKLAAARDLRALMVNAEPAGDASFDASSAHHIALLSDRDSGAGQPLVNPDGLGNRKPAGCKDDAGEELRPTGRPRT